MKKIIALFASIIVAATLFTNAASAAADLKLEVSGKAVTFQFGEPFIENGRSLVPLRDLLVGLGVENDAEHIVWNGKEVSVTAIMGDKIVKLSVGSKDIFLNGEKFDTLEVPAQNVDGRVYLPARAVAEAFGFYVDFDADTWTIKVQEVPFGGGVKADDYENDEVAAGSSVGLESMTFALDVYGVPLSMETVNTLQQYEQAFFAPDRSPLSLDDAAKTISENELAKNVAKFQSSIVNLTFVTIDTIEEFQLENGQTITGAVGHTGGEYREMTESWEDSTYFMAFFLGSTNVVTGDKATINGIPVGETTIELQNALGQAFTSPMYVILAGNLLSTADEYDLRVERSKGSTIDWSSVEKEEAERLEQLLYVSLNTDGLRIYDRSATHDLSIIDVQIEEYDYSLADKIELPANLDLTIPLNAFQDSNGHELTVQSGSFLVKITTNYGEFIRSVEFE